MIVIAIIFGCIIGALIGINAPMIPYTYSTFLAIAVVAALDSVFGGITSVLKKNFDYVILDTAPIGMVTDTLLIGRVADLSAYVCRADYTHKAEYTLINELFHEKKLPNICTIINGVDLKKRKYGYYYGYGKYGKHYGYGKRYGYGYGYGQEK